MKANPSPSPRSGFHLLAQGRLLFLLACLSAWTTIQGQEPPRLGAALNTERTLIRLELQGRAGINYEIEASSDLTVWTPIATNQAGNTILLNEQPLSGHHRFFRGRESAGSTNGNPISVTPLADTNLSVSFLVTTDGGSGVLYSTNGTQFTLTVPPLAVLDAEVITMTVVTNVGALPFSQGILGAVRLEPNRLALWGAATLEISLPAELDTRKIVSFTAQGNGSSFQLTPDRVSTNAVLIPVTQLGLVGSALALDTEFPLAANSVSFIRQNAFRAQSAGAAGCFPDREADAQFLDVHFTQLAERYSQRLASALVRARRAQSAGSRGDTFNHAAAERAELDVCSLIDELTGPIATQAAGNCALGTMIARHLQRIERQRQLLNLPTDDPRCPIGFEEQNGCAILKNCIQEIKECCERGTRGPQQIAAIYRNVRYDQARGTPCLTPAEIDAAIDACAPGKWTGTLTLKIDGRESRVSHPAPGATVTELKNDAQEFRGHITQSLEFASSQGTNVTLTVEGQTTQTKEETRIAVYEGDCGGSLTHRYDGRFARGPAVYSVLLTMNPGQPASVVITPTPTGNPTLPGHQTIYDYSQIGARDEEDNCYLKTTSDTDNDDWNGVATGAIFGAPATFQNNQLNGGADLDGNQLELPGTGRFEWRFTRHPERP